MQLNHSLSRRQFTAASLTIAGAASFGFPKPGIMSAQDELNQPDGTYLINTGSDLMPEVPVCWRLIANTAKPFDEAPELPGTLHFIMPTSESPFTVTNLDAGETVTLVTHVLDAVFGPEGDVEKRYVDTGAEAPYVAFELIVADADTPETIGTGTWLGATDSFTAPSGDQQMALVALVVNNDDPVKPVPDMGSDYPVIAYVQGQPVTIVDSSNRWIPCEPGSGVVLERGDTVRFAGENDSLANASVVFARFVIQQPY